MKRRRLLFAVLGAPIAIIEACSFPEVSFQQTAATEAGATDGTVPEAEASNDAAPDVTRQRPPDVDPEGGAVDAATRGDATVERPDASVDAGGVGCAGLGGDPCDCDTDESLNGGPSCEPPEGERADCDDFDPLVHPDVSFVAAQWDPRSPHLPANDWNCDGVVTKQLDYGVKCTLTDCTQGFAEDIPCGATGTYNICKPTLSVLGLVTLCQVGSTEQRVQGCR